ncbi:hypothetical protein OG730_34915 [Streptomyces sp. NBC_01298]|nr:hypothetical protein OG730_34915 [Streptomyces sp. NBC_01298]
MFQAGQRVLIVRCEDDPRAVGRTGRIVDEAQPGPLTGGRWTVDRIGLLIAPALCHSHEIQPT